MLQPSTLPGLTAIRSCYGEACGKGGVEGVFGRESLGHVAIKVRVGNSVPVSWTLESESTGFEVCKLNKQEKSTRMRKGNTFHLYWFN